jgi:integrase
MLSTRTWTPSTLRSCVGCSTRKPTKWGTLILFACATGLRPEEWIALLWEDIDIADHVLSVNKVCVDGEVYADQGKSETAFRTVALQRRALDALAALPRPIHSDRLVFTAPKAGLIDLDNWRARHWKTAVAASGLEPRPLYQMRHTYASLALAAGADIYWVSEQMGHRDIRVTLKHYARFQRRSAVDARNLGSERFRHQGRRRCVRSASLNGSTKLGMDRKSRCFQRLF